MDANEPGLKLTFLGTGTSAGVPMIGCDCPVCLSADPRDRRDRSSVVVSYPDAAGTERVYLIDTTPDLRHQAIRAGMRRLDGVLITHSHADHIYGLDDLRRFNAVMDGPIDVWMEPRVRETVTRSFQHIFEPHKNVNDSWIAQLIPRPLVPGEAMALPEGDAGGATWTPLRLMHGRLPIVGFRVDHAGASLAYCTDVSTIPPETWPLLDGLDVLVIDGLRERHHPTHLTFDQAVEAIERAAPKRAYLTHIAHDFSHVEIAERLPEEIEPAHDGLVVELGGLSVGQPASELAG
ncbi:MAG: MBL fold metallo-hydrolase [Planctomycetota bacterium]